MEFVQPETSAGLLADIPAISFSDRKILPHTNTPSKISKGAIRTSLRASTIDGVFATIFSITTTGILLSNFLVELGASPVVFGMVSSIPMVVNLVQPLGAYLSEQTTSRFHYALWTYGIARVFWAVLAIAVFMASGGLIDSHQIVILTLVVVLATSLLGGLGGASWMSWMAAIVPRQLRGRYFGFRNTVSSLTNLISVPLTGIVVSMWYGGTLQGYGVVLTVGVVAGIISIACQYFKLDFNPQEQHILEEIGGMAKVEKVEVGEVREVEELEKVTEVETEYILYSSPETFTPSTPDPTPPILRDSNFLQYLVYISLWMFAVNLSAPFFNLYMLDTLALDVSWVTFYGGLQAGANLLLIIFWGRLADKIGNRPILIFVGILVAATPILWLGVSGSSNYDLFLWLPLLHVLAGGTWAAIDLCSNNLQLGIAPLRNQARYFAYTAAVAGASGALGATIGGFMAGNASYGGLPALFAISGICRLIALVPLLFVQEAHRKSLTETFQKIRQTRQNLILEGNRE